MLVPAAAMLELGRAAAQQLLDDSKAAPYDAGGTTSSAEAALASASIAAPLMLPGVGGGVLPALRCLLSFSAAAGEAVSEPPEVQLQSRGGGVQPVTHLQARLARQAGASAVRGSTGATASCGSLLLQISIAGRAKAAAPETAACGALELHAEHVAPGWHCHPAALDATLHLALCAEPSPQHAQHGGGDDAAPAPPAKVPVAAACFRAPAQGQGAGSGGASWPLMACDAADPAATTASYALLGGSGAAAFHLHGLQSRAVGGRAAGAAAAAATAAAAVAGAWPVLASYAVQHAVHFPSSRAAADVSAKAEAAVSLSAGAAVSALLPAQPSGLPLAAAVFGGAQSVLRRLQESQQPGSSGGNPLRLAAATGLPSRCCVAPSRHGNAAAAVALAAAALAMLKCAAAEPGWQGAQPLCATHSSLAPARDCAAPAEADAPAGDLFAAPHRSQSAWLLPQLLGEPEVQAGTAGAAAAAGSAAAGQLAAEAAGGVAISGGLGALGLLAAAWLAGGSRLPCSIALWGRSASSQLPPPALRASLAPVSAVQCDVSVAADAAAATGLQRSVGSYWHAGGVLRDGLLAQQSAGALRAALAPKLGGWLAAAAALVAHPLLRQLLFSSVAALLGNAGQANYAAANAALDAAAAAAAACGVAAASLQWGPWAGGGMASAAVAASLAAKGVGLVQPAAGLALLDSLLSWLQPGDAVVAPLVALDWRRMLRPAQRASPFFAAVITAARPAPAAATSYTLNSRQASASAVAAAAAAAAPSLQQVQGAVLDLAAAAAGVALHPDAAFMSSGLDSLGELLLLCFTF